MSEKEIFVLSDPLVEPSWEFLQGVLKEKYGWWMEIRDHVTGNYPHVTEVWKYYNDGKQWLYRLMQKKNTIFWLAVMADTYRITFYFPKRAEPVISGSALPENIRTEFLTAMSYGQIRPITLRMEDPSQVETVKQLVALKLSLK